MNKNVVIKALWFAVVAYSNLSVANEWQYSGYVKSYLVIQDEMTIDFADDLAKNDSVAGNIQSQNAMRLMAAYLSSEAGNVEVHYEVQPLYFSNTEFLGGAIDQNSSSLVQTFSVANSQYRVKDINPILTEVNDNAVILQNLDRLNYQYNHHYGDFTIGRQVLSFGSARFINPTDIFVPFAIQTLNQEYRAGIDAIRFKADIGDFSLVDMGIIIGEDAQSANSGAFIRGKHAIAGNDIELIMIKLNNALLAGGGIERSIGDVGFWFETAYMDWDEKITVATSKETSPFTAHYWRTSIGGDYAINDKLIAMLEYHYNGAGSNNPEDYSQQLLQAPYEKAGVFLLGKHYVIPALSYLVSPVVSINASVFYNVSDNSLFLNVSSESSWTDNLYSDVGIYFTAGENLQYQVEDNFAHYHFGSEFGTYPVSLYASLRYYF